MNVQWLQVFIVTLVSTSFGVCSNEEARFSCSSFQWCPRLQNQTFCKKLQHLRCLSVHANTPHPPQESLYISAVQIPTIYRLNALSDAIT